MPIRLTIADDHALFRQGLKSLLLLQPDVEVVAEVDCVDDLMARIAEIPCDILLLDLQMERWSMDQIPDLCKLASVIVLTASEAAGAGVQALRLGARAIVQKRFAVETLMAAIRTVAAGMVWMPPTVQTELARQHSSAVTAKELTARETEIVQYVATALRNAAVAERLSISESTVKTHLNNIFLKLDLRDRLEVTLYAIKTGLVAAIDRER